MYAAEGALVDSHLLRIPESAAIRLAGNVSYTYGDSRSLGGFGDAGRGYLAVPTQSTILRASS